MLHGTAIVALFLGAPTLALGAPDGGDADPPPDADPPVEDEDEDEDEEDEPPPLIRLRPPAEHVPSALDDPDTLSRDRGSLPGAEDAEALPMRSTGFVRPRLAGFIHSPEGALRAGVGLGATVGQRWWSPQPRRVSWSGENTLVAEGVVGGIGGWRFQGRAAAGPWIGRFGLRFGPLVEVSRLKAGDDLLPTSLLAGGEVTVSADLWGVYPWFGIGTVWDVLGKRESAIELPTIGTETEWQLGVAVQAGWLQPRVEIRTRGTGIGPLTTGVVGVQIRPPVKSRDVRSWAEGLESEEDAP